MGFQKQMSSGCDDSCETIPSIPGDRASPSGTGSKTVRWKDAMAEESGHDDVSVEVKSIASSVTVTLESPDTQLEPTYHVFSKSKKRKILFIISLAGLFSPLSSNIYFPALGAISKDIGTDITRLSLTVTIYMVVQGIAPSFWGPISDARGRRMTLFGTFIVYLLSNIGLALSKNFATLMVFRALQAAGSAATISLGSGVIGDLTLPSERGGYIGVNTGIRMIGQSIGPVFGGVMTEYWGFRSIFWFLFALGSFTLLLILFFLPETLRHIAGDGTVPLTGIDRPFVDYFTESRNSAQKGPSLSSEPRPRVSWRTILQPLRFLFEKDVFVPLFFGAIVYAVWSMVTSSTTALLQPLFHLNNTMTGLVFLPNGVGCITGSYLTGRLLDRDYVIVEAQYRHRRGISADCVRFKSKKYADFPVARSRLRSAWYLVIIFIMAVSAYGFAVQSHWVATVRGGIAIALSLQFMIAQSATAIFTQNSALVVDLFPGASASATAVNNLIRCSLGAAGVAGVQHVIRAVGPGLTFLMCGVLTAVLSPMLWVVWVKGEGWRRERLERSARRPLLETAV